MAKFNMEIRNVEQVIDKTVANQGKITGLGEFVGRKVKVLVFDDGNGSNKKGRTTK